MSTIWKRTPIKAKVVALRVCEVCHEDYTPKWEEQRSCGGRCARVLGGRALAGKLPAHFAREIERRKQARRAAVERECRKRWPELSVREIEIFNFGVRVGYNRGYSKGLHSQRRTKRDAA